MIVFDAFYGPKIAEAAMAGFNPARDVCMARVVHGENVGGFIMTDYTGVGGSMVTHVAGFRPGWLTRELLFNTATYCFDVAKCGRIFGQVAASKPKVLAFDLKMGWKEVAFLPGVFPDGGSHVLSMTRDECRWLNLRPVRGENGEAKRAAAA